MSLVNLKSKFNNILRGLNGSSTVSFSTVVENAYEALVLGYVMEEYTRINGQIANVVHPSDPAFLKQSGGTFETTRAFKIDYKNGNSFYFATDVEIYGVEALLSNTPVGSVFEADVIVIDSKFEPSIRKKFKGYPGPQHLDSVYECKYGGYNKGQLRELLGLKRHIGFLNSNSPKTSTKALDPSSLFHYPISNSTPPIPLKLARPRNLSFFNKTTANLYDLEQLVFN